MWNKNTIVCEILFLNKSKITRVDFKEIEKILQSFTSNHVVPNLSNLSFLLSRDTKGRILKVCGSLFFSFFHAITMNGDLQAS